MHGPFIVVLHHATRESASFIALSSTRLCTLPFLPRSLQRKPVPQRQGHLRDVRDLRGGRVQGGRVQRHDRHGVHGMLQHTVRQQPARLQAPTTLAMWICVCSPASLNMPAEGRAGCPCCQHYAQVSRLPSGSVDQLNLLAPRSPPQVSNGHLRRDGQRFRVQRPAQVQHQPVPPRQAPLRAPLHACTSTHAWDVTCRC